MALKRKFNNGHSTDDNEAPPPKKKSAAQAEGEAPQPAPRTDEMQTDVEPCVAPLEQASATKTPAAEAPLTDTQYATASPKTSDDKVLEKMTKELEEAREMNKRLVINESDYFKRLRTAEAKMKATTEDLEDLKLMFEALGREVAYLEVFEKRRGLQ